MKHLTKILLIVQFVNFIINYTKAHSIPDDVKLKNCTSDNQFECPVNSVCMRIERNYICVCLEQYELNPQWARSLHLNRHAYCFIRQHRSMFSHLISPHERDFVAHSLLLVLIVGIAIVLVLWIISCLKPVKRTDNMYRLLKQRRLNRKLLEEDPTFGY